MILVLGVWPSSAPSLKWLSAGFEASRAHLRRVAYRMLGSLSQADDAVQETWIRLSRADTGGVENLGGWLTTVVARVCLDILRARRSRREESLDRRATEPVVGIRLRLTRAEGRAGGLGGASAAGRARDAGVCGASGVRAARHVRPAVRGDRADSGALASGDKAAGKPRAAEGSRRGGGGGGLRPPRPRGEAFAGGRPRGRRVGGRAAAPG